MLEVDYFNPIVDDWTEKHQKIELEKRKTCDYLLYVITPEMEGVYSIAEVVDDSNKNPQKTILCILEKDGGKTWTPNQRKSLKSVEKMIEENGAMVLENLEEIAEVLNSLDN
jgi:hypothetical protein